VLKFHFSTVGNFIKLDGKLKRAFVCAIGQLFACKVITVSFFYSLSGYVVNVFGCPCTLPNPVYKLGLLINLVDTHQIDGDLSVDPESGVRANSFFWSRFVSNVVHRQLYRRQPTEPFSSMFCNIYNFKWISASVIMLYPCVYNFKVTDIRELSATCNSFCYWDQYKNHDNTTVHYHTCYDML